MIHVDSKIFVVFIRAHREQICLMEVYNNRAQHYFHRICCNFTASTRNRHTGILIVISLEILLAEKVSSKFLGCQNEDLEKEQVLT